MLTDAAGVPLVVQMVAANQHDGTTMLPLVVNLPAVAGKPGRPKQKPGMAVADKAYDDKALRSILRWLSIEPILPKRGEDDHGLGVWRWYVERTISCRSAGRALRGDAGGAQSSRAVPSSPAVGVVEAPRLALQER